MNYRSDHIRLLEVFAAALPKKPTFTVEALAKATFSDIKKRKPDTALDSDRACRNALRKPRAMEHVEIAERGEYRLTSSGAAFCKKLESYEVAPDKVKGNKAKVEKVKAPKKAKEAKTAAKTTAKVSKAVDKAPVKAAKTSEKAAAKAPTKIAKASEKDSKEKAPVAAKAENTKPARKRLIPGLKPKAVEAVEAVEEKVAPVEEVSKAEKAEPIPADLSL